jgi:hypothetical protein
MNLLEQFKSGVSKNNFSIVRQIAAEPPLKIRKALELVLAMHAQGRKTAVFCTFVAPLMALQKLVEAALGRTGCAPVLCGDLKGAARAEVLDPPDGAIHSDPACVALLATFASGGVGLNLAPRTLMKEEEKEEEEEEADAKVVITEGAAQSLILEVAAALEIPLDNFPTFKKKKEAERAAAAAAAQAAARRQLGGAAALAAGGSKRPAPDSKLHDGKKQKISHAAAVQKMMQAAREAARQDAAAKAARAAANRARFAKINLAPRQAPRQPDRAALAARLGIKPKPIVDF